MHRFSTDREALDFVAAQVSDQAQRDGITLNGIERKMLYFSETAWTLPDMSEVSEEFDRDYDQGEFEKKVSKLIKNAVQSARKQQQEKFEGWVEAIRRLSKEDRFLMVMVKQARLGAPFRANRILWRLWGAAVAALTLFVGLNLIMRKIFPEPQGFSYPRGRGNAGFAYWAALVCIAVIYTLVRFLVGPPKFDHAEARAIEWIFGTPKRHG